MTLSPIIKNITLALSGVMLLLNSGCSSIPGLDNLEEMSAQPVPENSAALSDGYVPLQDTSFDKRVKLPPKNPHDFGIGVVLPTDASHQATAKSLRQGLELAVADVNAAGGINGQPIQLDIVDSSPVALGALRDHGESVILVGDASLAVAQAEQLTNYPQLIGFLCDYVAVPRLTPKNGVRVYLNGDEEARTMESYIEAAGVDHATVLYTNDLLGQSHQQYFLYLISGDHNIVTEAEGYTPDEHDFGLLANAVSHSDHEALVLAGNGYEYPSILAAFDSVAWSGIVLGYAGNSGLAPLADAGRLEQTAVYPLPEFATNPRATEAGRAFADEYKAKYGEDPGLPAAFAYDNIRVLTAAAAQATSSDPQKIRASFIALRNYTGVVGRYDIKDDGDTELPLRLWHADGQPAPELHPATTGTLPGDVRKLPLTGFPPANQP